MKEAQLNLFDLDDLDVSHILESQIKNDEVVDLSQITLRFQESSFFNKNLNKTLKRLSCLQPDTWFMFKNKKGAAKPELDRPEGFPYVKNIRTGTELKARTTRDGVYPTFSIPYNRKWLNQENKHIKGLTLRDDGKQCAAIDIAAHKLTALCFLENPDTETYNTVEHKFNEEKGFSDKLDYRPEQLMWLPMGENIKNAKKEKKLREAALEYSEDYSI